MSPFWLLLIIPCMVSIGFVLGAGWRAVHAP
jgi:hypothetical protein